MSQAHFVILYVSSAVESAAFYSRLLNRPAIESSPAFAMFALADGLMLGLWAKHTVEPAATATAAGASELAFVQPSVEAVKALHAQWLALGLPILQAPTQMDFGYTFTAQDLDGHRLRVFFAQ